MQNPIILIAFSGLLLSATECNNSKKNSADTAEIEKLYQSQWLFTEVNGTIVPLTARAHILFSDDSDRRVNGNTGCNTMSGNFQLSGANRIKFSSLAVTKMTCDDNSLNNLEHNILNVLSSTDTWKISAGELFLYKSKDQIAKLRGVKPLSNSVKNINGIWELNYVAEIKDPFDRLFPSKKPTLIFNLLKPEVTGNGGCNGFSSQVKIDGNKINFGDPLSTMMACEGGGEPFFFSSLKKITAYKITNDNTLSLFMGNVELLRFTKK